ncbi:peptidase S8 and S53, subtilisin, kexin, sedolisin, aprE [Deinococcus aerius]|uniref:Peptidase S8 and S53, subtilisin, kexin, sedolisin, aprE n=1 Tax=Deinococcus aerius TaxID=200253 RepID=A0A2I9DL12_9DEIO|nr:S8 family serine peptidase [Deinococcus aerius]GBF07138.1 peptidase S8 and S53, subtilisin, kexin, sedolisin, aprE [Deinococcus aerius]
MKNTTPAILSLSVLLAACGQSTPQPSASNNTAASGSALSAQATTLTECQALYATAPSGVQVDSTMRYGQVGTLILSFADDTSKGRAITWMDSNLPVDPGKGLGALQNLPVAAVKTLVTQDLIAKLKANLPGLVSIYQDAPLQYKLAESVKFIGADVARSTYGVTGKGVGVAVLDSGIDGTHPDLKNVAKNVKLVGPVTDVGVGGYLYVDTPNSDTSSGHGTHVASTIGGSGAASEGSARVRRGVAPGVTLVGVGSGEALSILYALEGFDYILKPEVRETYNIRVISNSWGSSGEFAPYNPISLAAKRAYDAGIIVTFAAGNEGPGANTLNPYSASPCVISVAAGDKKGYLADFSSRGRSGDKLVHPDVTAPGVDISAARALTGLAATTVPDVDNPQYSTISGTSMATPHISGVIALMLEANPKLTLDGVMAIFQKTSRPMYYSVATDNGLNPTQTVVKRRELWEVGYGYVDANAAVREAVRQNPTRYTVTTTNLPGWNGTVATSVCGPQVNCVTTAQDTHTLSVPAGSSALRVATEWGNPAYDLDLDVYDPSGRLVGSSAQGTSTGEAVSIPNPAPGNWKVVLKGYLNPQTTYTGTAQVDKIVRK